MRSILRKPTARRFPRNITLAQDGMYTVLCSTGLCGKVNKLEADDMMEEFRTLIGAEETAQETEEEDRDGNRDSLRKLICPEKIPCRRRSLHGTFYLPLALHTAGSDAFYEIFLCREEQNYQRNNSHKSHGKHLPPDNDGFRVQGRAQGQRNYVFVCRI